MMPELNGIELCNSIRNDLRTDHIPIIMLTARADRDSKLAGLETGADDYLVKPFDTDELRVRVNNLIRQRRALREKYRMEFITNEAFIKEIPDSLGCEPARIGSGLPPVTGDKTDELPEVAAVSIDRIERTAFAGNELFKKRIQVIPH